MERPIFKPVGTSVEELDTPALVVDLTVLERNIETMHAFFRQRQAKIRPYVETHCCPAIAHKQLAAGGTGGGICVATIGQGEVFAEQGFNNIFVANKVVTPAKIARLCALARHARIMVSVDDPHNVEALSEAARRHRISVDVVVDIHTRVNGCGVAAGPPAVELAKCIHTAEHLAFAGLMTREGPLPSEDPGKLIDTSRQWIQQVLDMREAVEKSGIGVRVVSVGGTYNYDIAGTMAGVTEVVAGSYALLDYRYAQASTPFKTAARVMATVTSRPEAGTAIVDAGQKAIGSDAGLPVAERIPEASVVSLSAEHGRLRLPEDADARVTLGDKIWLTPWDMGTCVNLYDYIHAVRDGKLEVVWDVAARGRYR
jgi:D-serine deaminase-like pyridoxal phosphate-dependent protein